MAVSLRPGFHPAEDSAFFFFLSIPPQLEALDYALKVSEEIADEAKNSGMPCSIDFSTTIPRLSVSFARLERKFAVEKRHVEIARVLYENLYQEGLRIISNDAKLEALLKLSDAELEVYKALLDLGGEEREVSLKELCKATELPTEKLMSVL
mgnify:CR=1 FL=1